eukprot:5686511-Prymnesium_polylepis.1
MADPQRAAAVALRALGQLRAAGRSNGEDPEQYYSECGVVKLGYAWEATHVRFFEGQAALARAMSFLCTQEGCESTTMVVQDFVPNDFEMR